MTDEELAKLEAEKKAKEEAEAKAKAEAEAQDDKTSEEDEEKKKSEEESKQLEAELKKEKEAREKAEKASAELAFKLREKKRKENDEDEDEEPPLTAGQLETILRKEREATRKEIIASEAERFASKFASTPIEKELVLEIFKNRTFPSHLSLEEQIEESYILANKKKLLGENSELKRALKNRENVHTEYAGTHHDAPTSQPPKFAPSDSAEYARLGFKWNGATRRFEKQLSNGQVLVRDIKTKTTFLVRA